MNLIIHNYIAYELAGLWPIIWRYGLGGVLLAGCGAGWYFSPIHRTDFIWAAVVIVVVMASTSIGVSIGEKRVQAQWDEARTATLEKAKQARVDGVRDAAPRKPNRWLPNHQRRDPDLRD